MAVKKYKPTTPGRRKASVQDFSNITKTRPQKSLVRPNPKKGGRNNTGKITVRHRGGGAKRLYRAIDFRREKFGIPAKVVSVEYDPNRGPRIALVEYEDGENRYVLAYNGIAVGDTIVSTEEKGEAKPGNRMPLEHIPLGLFVYNIEITPKKGGQMIRGAGTGAQLQVIEGEGAQIKLPSGEVRIINKQCMATIGTVSNADFKLVRLGKAGRRRHLGFRPTVRGKVMNPVDHPHGGGEGSNPIGLKGGPKTPWGKKALGVKTRNKKKYSNAFIIQPRKKKKK